MLPFAVGMDSSPGAQCIKPSGNLPHSPLVGSTWCRFYVVRSWGRPIIARQATSYLGSSLATPSISDATLCSWNGSIPRCAMHQAIRKPPSLPFSGLHLMPILRCSELCGSSSSNNFPSPNWPQPWACLKRQQPSKSIMVFSPKSWCCLLPFGRAWAPATFRSAPSLFLLVFERESERESPTLVNRHTTGPRVRKLFGSTVNRL